jgi:hypothetical protein
LIDAFDSFPCAALISLYETTPPLSLHYCASSGKKQTFAHSLDNGPPKMFGLLCLWSLPGASRNKEEEDSALLCSAKKMISSKHTQCGLPRSLSSDNAGAKAATGSVEAAAQ